MRFKPEVEDDSNSNSNSGLSLIWVISKEEHLGSISGTVKLDRKNFAIFPLSIF